MKIWSSEHTFSHPWETVVQASWRKYPNPITNSVIGTDILDRKVENGILKSHRLITTAFGIPNWALPILGSVDISYTSEHSEVNPKTQTMTMRSRNITWGNTVGVDEYITYKPHPTKKETTLMTQEAVVNVMGIPLGSLASYSEGFLTDTISKNAAKGREAMEYVIGIINQEAADLRIKLAAESANFLNTRPS